MKVGDYVRTPQGIIAKIVNIQEDTEQYFLNGNAVSLESKNYIADKNITIGENFKNSPNIIDLIEVGDIVNYGLLGGGMVIFKKDDEITTNTILFSNLKEKDIKKVITKEQIENLEYEVE